MIGVRHPEIAYKRRLVRPEDALALGSGILSLPRIVEADDTFNVLLGIARFNDDKSPRDGLREVVNGIEGLDDDSRALMATVGLGAMRRMSGQRRGGLPSGVKPTYVAIDANVYGPGETFATHRDTGLPNDVAAISLSGRAVFMHVVDAPRGVMPEDDQIHRQWDRVPGDAIFIRNHQTAAGGHDPWPLHAVQNGDEQRVSLQVQVSYSN
jgi:hypothetical protein